MIQFRTMNGRYCRSKQIHLLKGNQIQLDNVEAIVRGDVLYRVLVVGLTAS